MPYPTPTSEPKIVNPARPTAMAAKAEPPGLSISDVYYTVFRHKWKIVFCTIVGLTAAFVFYKSTPPSFQSEAKLFIRYVISEGKSIGPGRDDTVTKSPDQRGETIISSEVEVLTSMDLAIEVAKAIGPEKLLGAAVEIDPTAAAAAVVNANLLVEVAPRSSVIRVAFSHGDPAIVQGVLREVISSYLKKHVEIHRAVGIVGDFLTQETDQLRARLAQTEEELRSAMNKAGVISLEDSKRTLAEQISRLRQQIFDLQTELAERSSVLKEMTKIPAEGAAPDTAGVQIPAAPPVEQVTMYQDVSAQIVQLRAREQELLASYTDQSPVVQEIQALRKAAEAKRDKLETDFPVLKGVQTHSRSATPRTASAYDPLTEAARIIALEARSKVLAAQLDEVRQEAARLDKLEISILELRRRRELEEANYRYYSASLEQSRINEALGTGRVSNISQIEAPTPPRRDAGKRLKTVGMLSGAGLAAGLAWAFLIELFIDRSLRRPAEVERILRLPLFLSIPRLKGASTPNGKKPAQALPAPSQSKETTVPTQALVIRDDDSALKPFSETLRDRLISYFDTLNVRHKPKLVAVTGLGKGSGVTTIATGLARSFSETGEGNVLLVDMTKGQGSAQQFHKGTTMVGLEQMLSTKGSAQVENNLYVVSEDSNSERLAKGMPQRFNQLIPKLKASDFDYIIFDMPAVSQISITPRLANFMDMMLLVVESEKTDRDAAANASALLATSKTPLGVVLNKTKAYVPHALQQDASTGA